MAHKLIDAAQALWRTTKRLERRVDISPPEPGETTDTKVA
jgi:hypothetical protein